MSGQVPNLNHKCFSVCALVEMANTLSFVDTMNEPLEKYYTMARKMEHKHAQVYAWFLQIKYFQSF